MDDTQRLGAPWPGAVAVSGGGDSVALMLLLGRWAKVAKIALPVVLVVDHGLAFERTRHGGGARSRSIHRPGGRGRGHGARLLTGACHLVCLGLEVDDLLPAPRDLVREDEQEIAAPRKTEPRLDGFLFVRDDADLLVRVPEP